MTTARERVLIVEDDSAARIGLQQLVRGWGFDVETAADGGAYGYLVKSNLDLDALAVKIAEALDARRRQ